MADVASGLDAFVRVAADEDVPQPAQALFQRKYRRDIPEFPHHVVAYATPAGAAEQALCYVHFTDCGDILLGGGACTDDRVLRRLALREREALRQAGGPYQHALVWAVRHFAPRFSAIFGYCGDALAARVDRAVGFVDTGLPHLLVYWTREVDQRRRAQMIAKAHSFAPF
jgi:hypothetical protein